VCLGYDRVASGGGSKYGWRFMYIDRKCDFLEVWLSTRPWSPCVCQDKNVKENQRDTTVRRRGSDERDMPQHSLMHFCPMVLTICECHTAISAHVTEVR
jgi:hypothetical protein